MNFTKMKLDLGKYVVFALVLSFLISCNGEKKQTKEEVEVVELDLLPMYGSTPQYGNLQKNAEQLEADRLFLINSDEVEPSRTKACLNYIEFGWYYLNLGDAETAMRRANQAWQLNSMNPDVYVLFAAILNAYEAHGEAIDMLDRAINISPEYISLYDMYLSESVDLYRKTGDNAQITNLIAKLGKITITQDSVKTKVDKIRNDALEFLKK